MSELYACGGCARHVRLEERRCPFCSAELDPAGVPRRRYPSEGLSRAAQLAFTVTLGAHVTSCSSARDPATRVAAPTASAGPTSVPPAPPAPPVLPAPAVALRAVDAGTPQPRAAITVAVYGATTVMILQTVCFAERSSKLPDEALPTIQAVAEIFLQHRFHVEVRGRVAPSEENMAVWLSKKRAQVVVAALVAAGAPSDRFTTQSLGVDRKTPNYITEVRESRCVDFRIVPHEGDEPSSW